MVTFAVMCLVLLVLSSQASEGTYVVRTPNLDHQLCDKARRGAGATCAPPVFKSFDMCCFCLNYPIRSADGFGLCIDCGKPADKRPK